MSDVCVICVMRVMREREREKEREREREIEIESERGIERDREEVCERGSGVREKREARRIRGKMKPNLRMSGIKGCREQDQEPQRM